MAVATARRREYLAALGLDPLVLHVPAAPAAKVQVEADDTAPHTTPMTPPPTHARASAPDVAHVRSPSAATAAPAATDGGLFAPRPARLCLCVAEPDVFAGDDAVLLRAVLRAIGLGEADVVVRPRPDHDTALPVLSFGPAAPAAAVQAPALSQLRDAGAKRALWPALRRLRILLRSPA